MGLDIFSLLKVLNQYYEITTWY